MFQYEGMWQVVLTIGGGLASIVIWELVKTFGPDWLYDRITKFQREIRFRNKMYPVLVVKSFEATLLEPNLDE